VIYDVDINDRTRRVEVVRHGHEFLVSVDGQKRVVDVTVQAGAISLVVSDSGEDAATRPRHSHEVAISERPSGELGVHVNGRLVLATVASGRGSWARRGSEASAGKGPAKVAAPMPGKVVKVLVKPGDVVAARQGVVIIEAMKMENELKAPKAGTVSEVRAIEGTSVEAGSVLIVVE
jgi:biotin carboxyl carrier protein